MGKNIDLSNLSKSEFNELVDNMFVREWVKMFKRVSIENRKWLDDLVKKINTY